MIALGPKPRYQPEVSRAYDLSEKFGGRTRTRTWDPLIKSQLLYQLSYAPAEAMAEGLAGWETTNPRQGKSCKGGLLIPKESGPVQPP